MSAQMVATHRRASDGVEFPRSETVFADTHTLLLQVGEGWKVVSKSLKENFSSFFHGTALQV